MRKICKHTQPTFRIRCNRHLILLRTLLRMQRRISALRGFKGHFVLCLSAVWWRRLPLREFGWVRFPYAKELRSYTQRLKGWRCELRPLPRRRGKQNYLSAGKSGGSAFVWTRRRGNTKVDSWSLRAIKANVFVTSYICSKKCKCRYGVSCKI